MNYPDPNQQYVPPNLAAPAAKPDLEAPFVGNFKSSPGYDAAMLTIRGNDAAEFADRVGAAKAVQLGTVMGEFDSEFKATFNAGSGLGAQPVQSPAAAQTAYQQPPAPQGAPWPQQAPQAPVPPPGQQPPQCMHGVKKWVEGVNKQGKPYKFWGCPAPQADPSQCKPQWVN